MSTETPREQLKSLEKQRRDLEIQIQDLLQQIPQEFRNTQKRPKYVDNEGFPRADIDIWRIAEIRKQVVMLQNDHINIMKQIEKLLLNVFKNNKNNNNNNNNNKLDDKKINKEIKYSQEKKDIISNMKAF
eukprot:193624_1